MANPTQQQSVHDVPNAILVTGDVSAGVVIANSGFKAGALATAPVLTYGAGAGTAPPTTPVLVAGSNDIAGSLTWGTGTSTAIGAQVVVTFGTALAVAPKHVSVNALNDATGLKIPYAVTLSTTAFTIDFAVAPAASQGVSIYSVSYLVVQ